MLDTNNDNIVKFHKNDVYIVFSITKKVYTISTDKYQLHWCVDNNLLEVYDTSPNNLGFVQYIMSVEKKFDMNELAVLKFPNESPALLEIVLATKEYINHQIDRYMNLKAFF